MASPIVPNQRSAFRNDVNLDPSPKSTVLTSTAPAAILPDGPAGEPGALTVSPEATLARGVGVQALRFPREVRTRTLQAVSEWIRNRFLAGTQNARQARQKLDTALHCLYLPTPRFNVEEGLAPDRHPELVDFDTHLATLPRNDLRHPVSKEGADRSRNHHNGLVQDAKNALSMLANQALLSQAYGIARDAAELAKRPPNQTLQITELEIALPTEDAPPQKVLEFAKAFATAIDTAIQKQGEARARKNFLVAYGGMTPEAAEALRARIGHGKLGPLKVDWGWPTDFERTGSPVAIEMRIVHPEFKGTNEFGRLVQGFPVAQLNMHWHPGAKQLAVKLPNTGLLPEEDAMPILVPMVVELAGALQASKLTIEGREPEFEFLGGDRNDDSNWHRPYPLEEHGFVHDKAAGRTDMGSFPVIQVMLQSDPDAPGKFSAYRPPADQALSSKLAARIEARALQTDGWMPIGNTANRLLNPQ